MSRDASVREQPGPASTFERLGFVRGDIDGFFGLAIDNLVQLLVIVALCRSVLGFGDELLFGRILPGAAVSILVGNLFYAWQARALGRRSGRADITALPYGINTVSLFAFVFLVMLPAKLAALASGLSPDDAALAAWRAGLAACFGSGVLEVAGAFVAERIRRGTPRAALLSSLAGIAVSFIALGFFYKAYAAPLVGIPTLVIVLVAYFGRVRFAGGIPGGLVAVLAGTALCWITGLTGTDASWAQATANLGLRVPVPVLGDLLRSLGDGSVLTYLSVIVPMGVVNVIGSLQNIESASAAGDEFEAQPSLLANGLGTMAACVFGSCFPTTIYIGHPGWKAMGARSGYSILGGVFTTVLCLTGAAGLAALLMPIEAGMAIVLYIGIIIVAQAFEATPARHAAAVAVGLLPGIAAWGTLMLKTGLRAGGAGMPGGEPFSQSLETKLAAFDVAGRGAFALEQGFIFAAMILAAVTAEIIDRRFERAAAWCVAAAALSFVGLMHAYVWTPGDTVVALGLGTGSSWALAYLVAAGVLVVVPRVSSEGEGGH
jgi:AGZA family xanthine/uracil permease-like MFS transporter